MDDYIEKIGRRIAVKRKRKKWSQEKLAELAGLHRTSVGDIENGKYSNITLNTLKKVADALNCPLEILLKDLK